MHFDPLEALFHATGGETARLMARRRPDAVPAGPGELACSPAFWRDKRVVVTGCEDFLGKLVVVRLEALGCREILVPAARGFDLMDPGDVARMYRLAQPDVVFHLAERMGGIGAHLQNPGEFFFANLQMGMLLIEEARRAGVKKFVQMGTITSYPKYTPVPFREEDLWNGHPDESNAPYGLAKRALLAQLQAYRAQYGFNGICLLPANTYGPGDSFDPERSYVIPALIRRMVEAVESRANEVVVWGTGEASREFLFVDDCARALLLAAEHYEGAEPVNVGTGREIKIRHLAAVVAELTGFGGRISFDATRPDGQPRRCLDTRRAQQLFGFVARTALHEGLRETIRWYRESRRAAPASTPHGAPAAVPLA